MKVKHILALFIIGLIASLLGAMFKILHWQFAPELLITGTFLKIIAGILGIWKLFTSERFKEFLDR